MSRAGRAARRQRLIEAGQWNGPANPGKPQRRPLPGHVQSPPGALRLGWLWQHRAHGYPPIAMLACWCHALESMRCAALARKDDPA